MKYKVKVDWFCGYHGEPMTKEATVALLKFHNLDTALINNITLFEKVEEIPEWVICTKWAGKYFTVNKIYKLSLNESVYDRDVKESLETYPFKENKDNFREATPAEIEAHLSGFHIGDPITFGHTSPKYSIHFIGNITAFNYEAGFLHAEIDEDRRVVLDDNIQHDNPKIITEEGDKLYGDDKCWLTYKADTIFKDSYYKNFEGGTPSIEGKYFSKKENAQQYFATIRAEKRGIKIGTTVFNKTTKGFLGEVSTIYYKELKPNLSPVGLRIPKATYAYSINAVITLEKLAKEEGLSIKMNLPTSLVAAWADKLCISRPDSIIDPDYIEEFIVVEDGIPKFQLSDCSYAYSITGFKKFKEGWEAKQTKELEFEVGKWYKHGSKNIYCLFKQYGTNVGFYNGFWYNTAIAVLKTDLAWIPINVNKVKELLLSEAKKRYSIGTKYKSLCDNEYLNEIFTIQDHGLKMGNDGLNKVIFSQAFGFVYNEGKWAEIVENKLMLGDVEVEIKMDMLGSGNFGVWTKEGSVNANRWLEWFSIVADFYTHAKTGEIGLLLENYETLSVKNGTTEIGCIKNIVYEELQAVTKAIKTL